MKQVIHVITTIDLGGAEKQLLILAKEQVRSGRTVTVIYLKGKAELLEEFRKAGVNVIYSLANINPVKQVFILKKFLYDKTECIIHAHLPRAELLTFFAISQSKFIISRHNAEKFFPKAPKIVSSYFSRLVIKKTFAIIAISEAVKTFMITNCEVSSSQNIDVVYYGHENSPRNLSQSKKRSVTKNSQKLTICTIARLVPQKDLPTLLKAFQLFIKNFPNAALTVVGDGYLKNELQNLSENLEINHRVNWMGKTDNVFEVLKQSDLFVLTSLYEGFGLVLLEAMEAGIPILASSNTAIKEVLGTDYQGLFQTSNYRELARLMNDFFENARSDKYGEYLSSRLHKFHPTIMRENIDRLYEVGADV